jgi:peptidoglycan/LPS O-acetylase OafA/YrhL
MMTGRNAGIDLLRAWAVTLTVLMHLLWMLGLNVYRIDIDHLSMRQATSVMQAIVIWAYHSQHGVYIFFVLSGFLIADIWLRRTPSSYLTFLRQRALRLLPMLWVTITAAHFLPALGSANAAHYPLSSFVKNLFLLNWFLPNEQHYYLLVTWSLAWEWIFYISFPILFFIVRSLTASAIWKRSSNVRAAGCVVAVAVALGLLLLAHWWRPRGGSYLLLFSVGVTIAFLNAYRSDTLRRIAIRIPWWLAIGSGSAIAFIYAWYSPPNGLIQRTAYGLFTPHDLFAFCYLLPVALLFIKTSFTEWGNGASVRLARWVGEISYSIYLWHLLILISLSAYLPKMSWYSSLPTVLQIAAFCVILILITLGVSALSYRWFERPYFSNAWRIGVHARTAP